MAKDSIKIFPRKRRPRPAGEVHITSSSNIYVTYQNIKSDNYENVIISDKPIQKLNIIDKNLSRHYFLIRYKVVDIRKPNSTLEYQQISTFVDDLDHGLENNFIQTDISLQAAPKLSHADCGETCCSDEYDSFFSDDGSEEEIEKNHNGVDISNTKLPDPPASANQVYAFVKKIKNFGSLSKSLSKISVRKSSFQSALKIFESEQKFQYERAQFYETQCDYQKANNKSENLLRKKQIVSQNVNKKPESVSKDPYENMNFHTLRTAINNPSISDDSNSSDTMQMLHSSDNHKKSTPDICSIDINNSQKSKSRNGFKSRFRKSFAGMNTMSNMNNKSGKIRSTFYVSDSTDLDFGILEKTSTNDPNSSETFFAAQKLINDSFSQSLHAVNKDDCSSVVNIRKIMPNIRPKDPPPPPPDKKLNISKCESNASWYAECGVFNASKNAIVETNKDDRKKRNNLTSWYTEAGLYRTSGISAASSSGSPRASTGSECIYWEDKSHAMFSNEPLYQIYSAAKLEAITRDIEEQNFSDEYEVIELRNQLEETKSSRPSALQLVDPKQGPSRTLWSEILEVKNSGILDVLTTTEKCLQERKFEIITSEASYLKSLNLLRSHFANHPAFRDSKLLTENEHKVLFSKIKPVHDCSERLLCELESVWQENIMLLHLSKTILKHAEKYFHVYVTFCENQGQMDRTLRRLKNSKNTFHQILETLEADPICCGLSLYSFLMLPMQRITRLPLLIDAVFSKLSPDSDEYGDWKITLSALNKIVQQCNEAANRCEQAYEMENISQQIEFPSNMQAVDISPTSIKATSTTPRNLVRKGELVYLICRKEESKLTFGKKFSKSNIYAFLFTDLLILTKKKSEKHYIAFDYCSRSMLTVSSSDVIPPQLPAKEASQVGKNLILLTLLENHERKTVEMILSCPSISDQQRWIEALSPHESENPGEKLYADWDCPQVVAKHEYIATELDCLSLVPGDVINVTKKLQDGWYHGERMRDGITGWFPGSYTEEVNSSHVRARNLKQRYRLLSLTASYLESQKKLT